MVAFLAVAQTRVSPWPPKWHVLIIRCLREPALNCQAAKPNPGKDLYTELVFLALTISTPVNVAQPSNLILHVIDAAGRRLLPYLVSLPIEPCLLV